MSGAPPLPYRPPGGWAQPCIPEEPTGLFPPAPGWHRTCSGEQSQWTSSGELSDSAPIRPSERRPTASVSYACAPHECWLPPARATTCLAVESCCVWCVAGSRPESETRTRVWNQMLRLRPPAPRAGHPGLPRARDADMVTPVSQGKPWCCPETWASTLAA